jgi:UPF0755 protein
MKRIRFDRRATVVVVILLALIFIFQPISWTTVPKNGVLSVIIDRTDTTTADAVKKLRLSGVQTPEAILYPVVSAASAFSSSGLKKGCYQLSPKSSDFTFLQTCLGTRELPRYPDSGRSEYLGR